jgi:predicted secreted hydrolase
MQKRILSTFLILFALIALVAFSLTPSSSVAKSGRASVEWQNSSSEKTQAFKTATAPTPLKFPRDLGAHEDYQTEWWYYTGNLESDAGRPFGYELTIFRRGLTPGLVQASASESQWRSNQVYFAHFTVSDIARQAFYPAEHFSRGAAGLAGAQAKPYQVWLDDWAIQELKPGRVQLKAKANDMAIDLVLEQTLPPVLQGDRGYSVKGPEPGNASYYYSIVQQRTEGTVTVKDETFAVTGTSWKDHEYSTTALSAGVEGWDWFSLQFEDGSALMLYGLRRQDGTTSQQSSGTFIAADGATQHLNKEDWTVKTLSTWKSPASGATYPAQWQIAIPKLDRTLTVKPYMPNQELNISTTYWEGAVQVSSAQQSGQSIQGRGYVELTGYSQGLSL